ncbi:MAG: Inositol-1-monophosphatase [candidate division BRC1 bacterium ADurb.BinA364]|nr:MAG: Inositol-1-monophosphatase [candidate division BRC1 bacterium ADurb.BinA364]
MTFACETLDRLRIAAEAAAYRAGSLVLKRYGQAIEIGSKGREQMAGDVVTVADSEAQKAILDVLEGLDPAIGMLAEEEGQDRNQSRFEKDCFWSIDPLDGTLPFIERSNGFAIAIALVSREGEPLLGVAYLPAFGDLYSAIKGGPALKNGEPFHVEPVRGALHFSTSAADLLPPDRNQAINRIVVALSAHDRVTKVAPVPHGGAVAKACWVLENAPAVYVCIPRAEGGASLWDFAATACIAKAAGGWVSDMFGNAPELNRRESTFMHHKGVLYATDKELARIVIESYAQR